MVRCDGVEYVAATEWSHFVVAAIARSHEWERVMGGDEVYERKVCVCVPTNGRARTKDPLSFSR